MAIPSSSRSKSSGGFWPHWHENKLFALLLAILLVYGIVFLGVKIRQTLFETRYVGVGVRQPSTISVSATESMSVTPDLATVDLGVTTSGASANAAQDANTEKTNALLAGLQELGIESKDLKTSYYTVYPQYDYNRSPAVVVGYEASQTITVRVRNRDLVSSVLEKAGNLGATAISSLRFEVDDEDSVKALVREKAIAKAYEQALSVADTMGARIGGVVSYSETSGSDVPVYYDSYRAVGGGSAPDIAQGENEIEMTVYIDFSLQ